MITSIRHSKSLALSPTADIGKVDSALSPERYQKAVDAESAKLKAIEEKILVLQNTTAVKREGVQTRSGDTAATESASNADEEKLASLQNDREAISENLARLEDEKKYASSVDILLNTGFDLVIGATKDDPDNMLRDVRSEHSKSVIQRGELSTGRGLLMAIEARTTAHREVLRDEAARMMRPERPIWEGILGVPRLMADRIEALCHAGKVLYSREEVPIVYPAASFARYVLAKYYTNDVTYEPFLSKFIATSSLTMGDLAKQIKDNCTAVPFLWDKDLTERVGAFVATTTNPRPQLTSSRTQGSGAPPQFRRGSGKGGPTGSGFVQGGPTGSGFVKGGPTGSGFAKGGPTGRSMYKPGSVKGCNHCASLEHFVATCPEYKKVLRIRESRALQ